MKLVFFGSGAVAAMILPCLAAQHTIRLVVTSPPAAAGRKMQPTLPPAAIQARQLQLPLAHALTSAALQQLDADYGVVCDYGKMIPTEWFERLPMLNVHPSLLPRWRGATPVEHTLLTGDKKTGVTIAQINEELDSGDILAQWQTDLPPTMTAGELYPLLAKHGASLLLQVLADPAAYPPQKQDEEQVTVAPKISAAQRRLDFSRSAQACVRQVLAFAPAPGAYFFIGKERIRVLAAEALSAEAVEAGRLNAAGKELVVACADGSLRITRVQRAGKQPMSSADFLRGYRGTLADIH